MALILDAFAQPLADRILKLAEEQISLILGVKDELKSLQAELQHLTNVLSDAELRKISNESIRSWVTKLREILYDADDLLDDCRVEGGKLLSPSDNNPPALCLSLSFCSCFRELPLRNDIARKVRSIKAELEKIKKDTGSLSLVERQTSSTVRPTVTYTPQIADEYIVGIDEDTKLLVDLIIGGDTNKTRCPIYAIAGMPGIGKTTLAQKIANDTGIRNHFKVPPIFLCVSKEYNPVDLLNEIGRCITRHEGKEHKDAKFHNEAVTVARDLVEKKSLLFVLDDVWDDRAGEHLSSVFAAADGSRVLITTRNEGVARKMGAAYTHPARMLTNEQAWQMLRRQVFADDDVEEAEIDMVKGTGMAIVDKCRGLPLAIKTIAGMLRIRDRMSLRDWEVVLNSSMWNLDKLGGDAKPGLLLSYEDLPPELKQCFLYCSLFPEDYRFHQQTLVQMWIAEGLVKPNGQRALEEIGEECYNELVMRNMLQAVPEYYEGKGCTMHDLVRALAHHVSRSGGVTVKRRHLFFVKKNESDELPDGADLECFRTVVLSKNPHIKQIREGFFERLRHVRVLDISHTGIKQLPNSLGSLLQLRFLNLGFTKIRTIPESIAKLQYLETLKANDLKHLEELPQAITTLLNLRHLTVGSVQKQLKGMPVGIRNLSKLRTLRGFVVNDAGESNLKELGALSDAAHIAMFKLENVATKEDAPAARLAEKKNLNFLRLSCTRMAKGQLFDKDDITRIEGVFEGLEPHRNLDALHVDGFFGVRLPSYILRCSLENLHWLRLDDCRFIEKLPPLGKLPMLRALHIWGATAMSRIGPEFFSSSATGVGFPQLREFYLKGMTKLREIAPVGRGALPRLKKLQVIRCPRLKSLPDGLACATKLTHLLVEYAENIEEIRNLNTVTELKLKGNSKLKVISGLNSLDILTISNCCAMEKVINCSAKMSYLSLSDTEIKALPEWLKNISSLRRLHVQGNRELVTGCVINGAEWSKIDHVLHLQARTEDGSSFVSYRKDPFSFQSNLTESDHPHPVDQPSSSNADAIDDEEVEGVMSHYDHP